jgi:radical SAM protein with 4Fe4S-binding SPASM domain
MSETTVPRGPSTYRDPHLEHRKAQERAHFSGIGAKGPMESLVTIELNATELCNRKCVFCPRVDPAVYPNRNLNMEISLAERVAGEVGRLGLKSRLSFSGYGEPLLHRQFSELVCVFRRKLPENTIEINTNGDRLTPAKVRELFDAGLTYLYINLYDGPEQREHFEAILREAQAPDGRWKLRPHWVGAERDFGLTLNNRSGMVNAPEAGIGPLARALEMRCHYPFYKMIVDWNGDVLFCSNDWGREIVVGNLKTQPLDAVWMAHRMYDVRRRLMAGDRSHSPCSKCSVHGTLSGEPSFRLLLAHYLRTGEIGPDELPPDLSDLATGEKDRPA